MKYFRCIRFFGLLMLVQITGCKQVYIPPSVPLNSSYLVVDGMLFNGNDSSVIRLSRSRSLADTTPRVYELNAQVSVVNVAGVEYPFTEEGNGRYLINQLNLDNRQKYQLKIITMDGNEYRSDSVVVLTTPPIDSVTWMKDAAGVHTNLYTGDPQNNTNYYRWEYDETWEYHSAFESFLDYVNGQAVFRTPNYQIYACYKYSNSTDINVASSSNLSQDLVNKQPIAIVPYGSEKISVEYSLLVKQYALTKDAFLFWQNLKTNSQNLGSLFDLQPYTQLGNIHCVNNPVIPVIGYVSFCTLQQTRIFISQENVSPWGYISYYGDSTCILLSNPNLSDIFPSPNPPYANTLIATNVFGAYLYTAIECADCRLHGGTTNKPSFWP
jgi:hypothetical protein